MSARAPQTRLSCDEQLAIHQLYASYAFTVDTHDFDGWIALWTEDGVFENPDGTIARGHAELRAQAVANSREVVYHWTGNLLLTAAEHGADAQCYLLYIVAGPSPTVRYAMYYSDQLVRRDGQWLYRSRRVKGIDTTWTHTPARETRR
jgi:hypothetical protein